MKKLLLLATLFVALSSIASAQYWVSGGFSYTSSEETNDDKSSSFTITPRLGYELNDKWTIGGGIGYRTSTVQNGNDEESHNLFEIAPFARYKIASFNKLNFSAEGVLAFGFGSSKYTENDVVVSEPDLSSLGFSIAPVVGYEINEKWELETTINLFGLNYQSYTEEEDGNSQESSDFYLGAGTDNIFTTGAITVSAIYKF